MADMRSIRASISAPPPPPERKSGGGLVLAAVAMVACGVAVGGGIHFWKAGSRDSAEVEAATGRREVVPAQSVVDTTPWDESDAKACAEKADAAAALASQQRLEAVSADRLGLGGPDTAIMRSAARLLCNATTKPEHLCDPYHRDELIEAVRAYLRDSREISAAAYWTKFNAAARAKARGGKQPEAQQRVLKGLDATIQNLVALDEEIKAALQALAADGIISAEDFGVIFGLGVPPDVDAIIGDVLPLRQACG
jgi:hypothetical protein